MSEHFLTSPSCKGIHPLGEVEDILSLVRVLGFHPGLVHQLDGLYLGEELEVQDSQLSGYLGRAVVEQGGVWGQVGWQLKRNVC